jgi:Rod binding domain-containing protein
MNAINRYNATTTAQLPITLPSRENTGAAPIALKGQRNSERSANPSLQVSGSPDELREKFTQFVGEAFYGQMFKAMRSTVGKPAYFNGGRAEEVFQGQLDQTMSQQLTKTTASKFAEPMFERQFPHLAEAKAASDLTQLNNLRLR